VNILRFVSSTSVCTLERKERAWEGGREGGREGRRGGEKGRSGERTQ